ncbi:MAG TPA: isocitrate lyase/phosphoenolpyruvate mutase family protein [Candidatus Binatia bacterium]|nr:isocitrate lyase/phosphoenolpyruvate mutase family protein [Candidatus Binatia bacterium]
MTQQERAAELERLHRGPELLILPNAWDAASARVFESVGARAIATTSSGVATSLGHRDGNRLPRDLAIAAIGRIARVVAVPVTADVEEGYGDTPEAVAETAELLVHAGAVGANLEDAGKPTSLLVERIRAVRERLARIGAGFFLNARIDVLLRAVGPEEGRLDEVLRRAEAYTQAGADGLFVPRLSKPDEIERVCRAVSRPVNLLLAPGMPPVAELRRLGVARLSVGGGLQQAALGAARRWAKGLLERGDVAYLEERILPADLMALFPEA